MRWQKKTFWILRSRIASSGKRPRPQLGMDNVSQERRSWIMSRIKGRNTRPELLVRRFLHALGFRYSLHTPKLPGRPDLAFSCLGKVIFVNGCFWHGHQGCTNWRMPESNQSYWQAKIEKNQRRDARNLRALRSARWQALTVWECELSNPMKLIPKIVRFLGA